MRLYHFTAGQYLRGIAKHGLTVGDVPIDTLGASTERQVEMFRLARLRRSVRA